MNFSLNKKLVSRIDAEFKQQKEKSNSNGKLTEQFLKGWHTRGNKAYEKICQRNVH